MYTKLILRDKIGRKDVIRMVKIFVREGQSIESALRVLKRKLQREKVIEGHKQHLRYEKPSDKLRKERFQRYVRAKRAQTFLDSH